MRKLRIELIGRKSGKVARGITLWTSMSDEESKSFFSEDGLYMVMIKEVE